MAEANRPRATSCRAQVATAGRSEPDRTTLLRGGAFDQNRTRSTL